jgi:hypothetical protein
MHYPNHHCVAGLNLADFFFAIADNGRIAVSAPAQHLHLNDPEMAIWPDVKNAGYNGINGIHQNPSAPSNASVATITP